jgi:hypothetical protein
MTKLLEKAFAKARELPAQDQDSIAIMLLSLTADPDIDPVDEKTRVAILDGLEQARREDLIPDADIEALWKRHGV